jgi:hypothetical protein
MTEIKRQQGYIYLDGFFITAVVVLLALGVGIGVLAYWAWPLVKAWIHGVTA